MVGFTDNYFVVRRIQLYIQFNSQQLAKIKIEDDGSYVQLSEVNIHLSYEI